MTDDVDRTGWAKRSFRKEIGLISPFQGIPGAAKRGSSTENDDHEETSRDHRGSDQRAVSGGGGTSLRPIRLLSVPANSTEVAVQYWPGDENHKALVLVSVRPGKIPTDNAKAALDEFFDALKRLQTLQDY